MGSQIQNGYPITQPLVGMVNNVIAQLSYSQPPMTNVIAYGGSLNNYQTQLINP